MASAPRPSLVPAALESQALCACTQTVRLMVQGMDAFAEGEEPYAIHYTLDGHAPNAESKRYTTPFFLSEDGQACQFAAPDEAAARGAPWSCDVSLRAVALPVAAERTCAKPQRCACYQPSEVYNGSFRVLSA